MEKLRVGILSTGNIAATMAGTVKQMKEARVCAVASRNLEKAEKFAERFEIPKAYGSYEELAKDEELDVVYVATPMSEHYENVKMLLNHGRNVLCEKSFALNKKTGRGNDSPGRRKRSSFDRSHLGAVYAYVENTKAGAGLWNDRRAYDSYRQSLLSHRPGAAAYGIEAGRRRTFGRRCVCPELCLFGIWK